MKQLDPKSVWLFFLNSIIWTLFSIIPIAIFANLTLSGILSDDPNLETDLGFLTIVFNSLWILILIILILAFVWARLSYKFYKYELREDGFRKEHGVIWKKYVTIPYERIQNVDIYRGLLARILGLSDLNIQTAGMSTITGSYGGSSEGRLPGLNPQVAEQLRDELVNRAKSKTSGV